MKKIGKNWKLNEYLLMGWSESHISLTFQWQKTAKIESLMNNTVDDGMEWKSHNVDILMKKIGKNCKSNEYIMMGWTFTPLHQKIFNDFTFLDNFF